MSHILLDGDSRSVEAVRTLLAGWGLTSASLTDWPDRHDNPTTHECDVVLLALDDDSRWAREHASMTLKKPEGAACDACPAPAAPLLLLSRNPGRLLLFRDAWQVVEEPGPGGADLRFALQACVDRARRLRGEVDGQQLQEDYFHFLGHELRSPLTAVKTALEVLQGDLGGLSTGETSSGEGPTAHAGLKMIDIALRNVRRLHDTVNWSQDLLEMSRNHIMADTGPVAVSELSRALSLDDISAELPPATMVLTDLDLLSTLADQARRLLDYLCPGAPVQATLRPSATAPDSLVLGLALRQHAVPAQTMRTGLASAPCHDAASWQELANFMVSRPLLDQLDVDLKLARSAEGAPGLELSLPLVVPAETGKDQPGLLRTHA